MWSDNQAGSQGACKDVHVVQVGGRVGIKNHSSHAVKTLVGCPGGFQFCRHPEVSFSGSLVQHVCIVVFCFICTSTSVICLSMLCFKSSICSLPLHSFVVFWSLVLSSSAGTRVIFLKTCPVPSLVVGEGVGTENALRCTYPRRRAGGHRNPLNARWQGFCTLAQWLQFLLWVADRWISEVWVRK